jgi:hypothetical protein
MIFSTVPKKVVRVRRTRAAFRRCVRLMTISVLAITGVLATSAPAHAQVVTIAELRPQHTSGMCLDVADMSQNHAAEVIQGTCWGGPNQRWWFRDVPGNPGVFEIHPLHSNMCLDVEDMSHAHTARVLQARCSGRANQHWRQVGANGFFTYQPQHTSGKCLDVAHMSHAHTARVIQGNCSGGANQLWLRLNVGEIDVP